MFLEDFEDIVAVSEDGKVKVVIEWIGEGIDGDYDEEDPDDEPLCRFSVYRRYDRDERMDPHFLDDHTPWGEYDIDEGWRAVADASYCTQLKATLPRERLEKAARLNRTRETSHERPLLRHPVGHLRRGKGQDPRPCQPEPADRFSSHKGNRATATTRISSWLVGLCWSTGSFSANHWARVVPDGNMAVSIISSAFWRIPAECDRQLRYGGCSFHVSAICRRAMSKDASARAAANHRCGPCGPAVPAEGESGLKMGKDGRRLRKEVNTGISSSVIRTGWRFASQDGNSVLGEKSHRDPAASARTTHFAEAQASLGRCVVRTLAAGI